MEENFCFETLKTPLPRGIKERGDRPVDNIAGAGSVPRAAPAPDTPKKDARAEIILGVEIEVKITEDRPTAAEMKAVEDFFDWLLAEALRATGEVDKAA